MVSPSEELFRKAAGKVFNGWTALQLAVEHGMGGPQGRMKALSMIDAVVELFKDNPNAEWQDVADLLSDMMDDEFNTICEDDSPDEVGTLLWEFFQHSVRGDEATVEAEMAKLPTGGHWLSQNAVPGSSSHNNSTLDQDSSTSDDDNTNERMDDTEITESESQAADPDPGWTQVTRKKRGT